MKIISLVPSFTETLFDFGLTSKDVIGRTKFCIHPKELVKNVEVIGGTKNLNLEKIKSLKPDLIIANKEENEKSQVEELAKHFKVWVTDIQNIEDNESFLTELGSILKKEEFAVSFNKQINSIFKKKNIAERKKVSYLIWKNPYMTVGSGTFIHEIMEKSGFENFFQNRKRYPEISIEEMKDSDLIFLSSEPFPFRQKHIDELQLQIPNVKIILVDGEAFSWYGTHLAKCADYFDTLIDTDF